MKKMFIATILILVSSIVFLAGCTEETSEESESLSIESFIVTPGMINYGETANLSWEVKGATEVSIDNDIGNVSLTGTQLVMPLETTQYTLTASGSEGSITASATIYVIPSNESNESVEETPTIECIVNASQDSLTISYADSDINWSDISVKTTEGDATLSWNGGAANHIGYTWTVVNNENFGASGNVTVGDYFIVAGYPGDVKVSMRYDPTDTILGDWIVNV
jgi:hypothetical protein